MTMKERMFAKCNLVLLVAADHTMQAEVLDLALQPGLAFCGRTVWRS